MHDQRIGLFSISYEQIRVVSQHKKSRDMDTVKTTKEQHLSPALFTSFFT